MVINHVIAQLVVCRLYQWKASFISQSFPHLLCLFIKSENLLFLNFIEIHVWTLVALHNNCLKQFHYAKKYFPVKV